MTKHLPIIGTYYDANTAIGVIYGSPAKRPTLRDLKRSYRVVVGLSPADAAIHGNLDFKVTSDVGDLVGADWSEDFLTLETDLVDRRIRHATITILDITKSRPGTQVEVVAMDLADFVEAAIANAEAEEEESA